MLAIACVGIALTLAACTGGGGPAASELPPTPRPTPPTTIAGICAASAPLLGRLDALLEQPVTAENLVDLGTAAATVTGIIAVDEQRLRSAPSSDRALVDQWLSALSATVNAGATAVRSAAAGDALTYEAAMVEMREHRTLARSLASELGYPTCPY